ncbi:MAG: protoporphyrinogen oxidase, partial [Nocardioidaceae bacterium]
MTEPPAARVVVVGGGIAGAATAHALRRLLPDVDLLVLEASDRVGGKLHRVELAGSTIDVGAEAMLARRPEALDLARDCGLADLLTRPATTKAALWTRGALRPLPPSVLGVPADLRALEDSGVVSTAGLERARRPGPQSAVVDDVSVGDFVSSRLGAEICDRLVEPLLGGVYAGHARTLSLRAAAPQIAALAERDGPLVDAAAASLRSSAG